MSEIENKLSLNKVKGSFLSDNPLLEPEEDKFHRWPFAKRIAKILAYRQDVSSITIGIYGAWGEGKTTVLNFIEKELKTYERVICIRFNPWFFDTEKDLIQSFFANLENVLKEKTNSFKDKICETFQKYRKWVSIASSTVGMEEVIKSLEERSLEEYKSQINEWLKQEEKRIVVFMDDIDRLDRKEIQIIFKLVKLCADFSCTNYVLAFDHDIVAASLGEKYGTGDKKAGKQFLEKIIQVPLCLPSADQSILGKLSLDGIRKALELAEISFSEEQHRVLVDHFINGLLIRIETPRMCLRFINILYFYLPILKDEINTLDLIFVEGMRIFYPHLYEIIPNHADIFLGTRRLLMFEKEDGRRKKLEVIEKGFEGLNENEREAAQNLLCDLFPYTKTLFDDIEYCLDLTELSKQKRIASPEYFKRFFVHAILEDDISDQEIEVFLENTKIGNLSTIMADIIKLSSNVSLFLDKIRRRQFNPDEACNLILALASLGHLFPNPTECLFFDTPLFHFALFIRKLVKNLPFEKCSEIIRKIAKEGHLEFTSQCFLFLRPKQEEPEEILSKELEKEVCEVLAKRILELENPIYYTRQSGLFFTVLSLWKGKEITNPYMEERLNKNPKDIFQFLQQYLPLEERMKNIEAIVDFDIIYSTLVKIYGDKLKNPQYDCGKNTEYYEKLSNRFAYLYQEKKKKS